ncbi:MAG: family 10 glycosylhydrolase [Armatimonadota bacterium]
MSITALLLAVSLAAAIQGATGIKEHRGVWLHPSEFSKAEDCDKFVERMAAARLNVAYPLVWYRGGQASWRTDACAMDAAVTADYDPLGYLVDRCHEKGLQVHAWFVNGALGAPKALGPLANRTDWLVHPAPGKTTGWWDLGNPEVREFQKNLMVEVLRKYDVDGVHFDYIRYSGQVLCFCDHCTAEFRQLHGHDVMTLAGESFPLARAISGNPIAHPTTAKVLVALDDGMPAIAVNELGQGRVLLLNWHAYRDRTPAVSTVVRRFLESAGAKSGEPLFLFRPEATIAKYGRQAYSDVEDWLRELGYQSKVMEEAELGSVGVRSVICLVAAYYTPGEVAQKLVSLVEGGCNVIVIDGPVYGMKEPAVQKLTGFSGTASYFSGFRSLVPQEDSDLVPTGGKLVPEEEWKRIAEDWASYRKDGVSRLVRDVYEAAKAVKPEAAVTAAVFQSQQSAEAVYQDWPRWLREGFIDYVLPMAYVMENERLTERLGEWKGLDPGLERIIPGLSLYQRTEVGGASPRPADLVLQQVDLCRQAGARGVNFFALAYLSDEIISALNQGPFRESADPYVPLQKE